jgi:hypothetical protein
MNAATMIILIVLYTKSKLNLLSNMSTD